MECYKLFGSAEFLGNPVGLAQSMGSGTLDFFAEPARGLMISPEAFGSGLAKGSGSLLKGALGGVMSAASAITGSASKAMATATGDESFIASQAASAHAKQPEHVGQGLKMGLTSFGSSIVSGVSGVFLDPMAGAKKEGIAGFGKVRTKLCLSALTAAVASFPSLLADLFHSFSFSSAFVCLLQGLVKGVAGLAFKPIAGVLDLTSNTLRGVGNTASFLLEGPQRTVKPVRPRRYIDPHTGVVTLYDADKAARHDPLWKDENKARSKAEEKERKRAEKEEKKKQEMKSSSHSTTKSS